MRSLTVEELGFVSGGAPQKDQMRGSFEDFVSWLSRITGTISGCVFGAGFAISRNEDGSVNVGAAVGTGVSISNSGVKKQGVDINLTGVPVKKGGKWTVGSHVVVWAGATTDAENTEFWDRAFGKR